MTEPKAPQDRKFPRPDDGRPPRVRMPTDRFDGLGNALRVLRRRRKTRMVDVAKRIGISPSMVSRWEKERVMPTLESLGRLGDVYGLHFGDLDDLVTDTAGLPRRPRDIPPPRTAAEAEALATSLMGEPATGEPASWAGLRRVLRAVLLEIAATPAPPRA